MRKVELRMNELEKYNIIKNLVDNNGNKNTAAIKLHISRRQIDRLIIKYKETGKSCFVHGNRGHIPTKALDKSISENIILLYQNKYYDCNFNHFKDLLSDRENIDVSYNFIYRTLTSNGIYSPKIRRVTKRKELLLKKDNQKKSKKEIESMINHLIDIENSHPKLRIEGITNIEDANDYLINKFIPNFNKCFALNYKKYPRVFETSPSANKINYTLAILSTRKIDNGNSIKFKNKYYQPFDSANHLVCFKAHTECLIIEAFDGSIMTTIDEKVYQLKELKKHKQVSTNLNEIIDNIPKEKRIYIPPMSHPWKAATFKKQLEKAHTNHVYA